MLTFLIALLLQLGILGSSSEWHQLTPDQQQRYQSEYIITEDTQL